MKLSPPASSSDLEVARQVARRLHELRRQSERPVAAVPVPVRRPAPPAAPAARLDVVTTRAAAAPPAHQPVAHAPAPKLAAAPPRPVAPPLPEPPPLPPTPPPVVAPPRPMPPVQPAPAPRPAAVQERPAVSDRTPQPPAVPEMAVAPSWDEAAEEPPKPEEHDALSALGEAAVLSTAEDATPPGDDDAIEIEETDATLEDMVDAAGMEPEEEIVGPADLEVGEPPVEEDHAHEPAPAATTSFASAGSPFDDSSMETVSEELFDLPPSSSWDEVVENCLMITHARGAMLIDPAGHVLSSNGFWPEPGPEPIAAKLVGMMEKTLKDAPTRSVSAPVGSMHLTAWRVPLAEGLFTVAFLADAPLRAETRTPVDAEILRGAP